MIDRSVHGSHTRPRAMDPRSRGILPARARDGTFYLRALGIVSFTCFAEWWMSSSGEDGAEAGFFQDGGYFFSLIALDFDIAIFHRSASAA